MKNDPIVEEIHRIREKMLDECGGDMEKLMDRMKSRESEAKNVLSSWKDVKKKPRPIQPLSQ